MENRSGRLRALLQKTDPDLFPVLLFLLTGLNFTGLFQGHYYMKVLSLLLVLFAAALFAAQFSRLRAARFPLKRCTLAFAASYLLSTLLLAATFSAGTLTANLKGLLWLCVFLFVLYPQPALRGQTREHALQRFLCAVLIFSFVQTVISFDMLLGNYFGRSAEKYYVGYYLGRLFGNYTDPNYGAILSAVSVVISAFFLLQGKEKHPHRVLLVLNLLLEYLYIAFSYSRSGLICLTAGLAAFALYLLCAHRAAAWKGALVLCLAALLFFGAGPVRSVYEAHREQLVSAFGTYKNSTYYKTPAQLKKEQKEAEKKAAEAESAAPGETAAADDPAKYGSEDWRDAEVENDPYGGRLEVWGDGLTVFRQSPVWGVTYRGIYPYMKANLPDSYMVTHVAPIKTFHNAVVDVGVSQGVIGLGILLVSLAAAVRTGLQKRKTLQTTEQKDTFALLGCALFVILCGAMFVSDIFYINTPTAAVFWYLLGHALAPEKTG